MQKFTNLKWFIFDFLPDDRFQSEINIPIETTGVAAAVAVVVAAAAGCRRIIKQKLFFLF